jgi:hypothetical protein
MSVRRWRVWGAAMALLCTVLMASCGYSSGGACGYTDLNYYPTGHYTVDTSDTCSYRFSTTNSTSYTVAVTLDSYDVNLFLYDNAMTLVDSDLGSGLAPVTVNVASANGLMYQAVVSPTGMGTMFTITLTSP